MTAMSKRTPGRSGLRDGLAPQLARSVSRAPLAPDRTGQGPLAAMLALQHTAGNHAVAAALRSVERTTTAAAGPLEEPVRTEMEQRFNHDFSDVRVHTDRAAVDSATSIDAKAYTVGSDIVFNHGRFAPHSGAGKRLLAHELAHVVQQSSHDPTRRPAAAAESPSLEAEAATAADAVAAGGTAQVSGVAPAGIARAKKPKPDDLDNVAPAAAQAKAMTAAPTSSAPTQGGVPWNEGNLRRALPSLPSNENYVYKIVTDWAVKPGVTNDPLTRIRGYAATPRFPGDTMKMGNTFRGMTIMTAPDAHLAVPQAKGLESYLIQDAIQRGIPVLNQKVDTLLTEQNIRGMKNSRIGAFDGVTQVPTGALEHGERGWVTILNPKLYPPKPGGVGQAARTLLKNMKGALPKLGGDTRGAITPRGAASGALSALQVWGAIRQFKDMRAKGTDPVEAAIASGAQLYGGLSLGSIGGAKLPGGAAKGGGGGIGMAINLVNAGLQFAGAPKEATDVSATAASATPGSFIPTVLGEGARSLYNIGRLMRGDPKAGAAIDAQVKEMIEGKGAMMPLSGYARPVDITADLFSGKGFEQTMLKQKFVGQEESVWNATAAPLLLRQIKMAEGLIRGKGLKKASEESLEMEKNAPVNRAFDYTQEQGKAFIANELPRIQERVKEAVVEKKQAAGEYLGEKLDALRKLSPF